MVFTKNQDWSPPCPQSAPPAAPYQPPPPHARRHSTSNETPVKARRPDREVYVPRARRSGPGSAPSPPGAPCPTSAPSPPSEAQSSLSACSPPSCVQLPFSASIASSGSYPPFCAPGPRTECPSPPYLPASPPLSAPSPLPSAPSPPKRVPTRSFCNVYQPPHLRAGPPEDGADGCAPPAPSSRHTRHLAHDTPEHVSMEHTMPQPYNGSFSDSKEEEQDDLQDQLITNVDSTLRQWNHEKDQDKEQNELRRASQEINRSNRRLIKQSFDSDVLVISEPVLGRERCITRDTVEETHSVSVDAQHKAREAHAAPEVRFNPEEEDWEAMLDENGECLEPGLLAELSAAVGRVAVAQPRVAPASASPSDEAGQPSDPFSHVLEVYNFPPDFKETDLLSVFTDYKDTGFEIKWVDDNHALVVFSSTKIAQEVLACWHPLVRTRRLQEATAESRQKARRCAESLRPYRARPETCAALARRLVSSALGVRLPSAPQERLEERRLLTQAREKKRLAAQHREAAWDGSLADSS